MTAALGLEPSVRTVEKLLRAGADVGFRRSDLTAALRTWRSAISTRGAVSSDHSEVLAISTREDLPLGTPAPPPETPRETPGKHLALVNQGGRETPVHSGPLFDGIASRGPALDISSSSGVAETSEDSGDKSPTSSRRAASPKTGKGSRPQTTLPLGVARKARAREILALLWPRVEPAVHGRRTRSGWTAANMRAAEELADLERSDEDILDAHDVASAKFGEPVYMVAKIVDSLPAIDVDDDAPANLDALYLEAHPHG